PSLTSLSLLSRPASPLLESPSKKRYREEEDEEETKEEEESLHLVKRTHTHDHLFPVMNGYEDFRDYQSNSLSSPSSLSFTLHEDFVSTKQHRVLSNPIKYMIEGGTTDPAVRYMLQQSLPTTLYELVITFLPCRNRSCLRWLLQILQTRDAEGNLYPWYVLHEAYEADIKYLTTDQDDETALRVYMLFAGFFLPYN